MAKKDLDRVNKAAEDLEDQGDTSREVKRQLESIRRQKENKVCDPSSCLATRKFEYFFLYSILQYFLPSSNNN